MRRGQLTPLGQARYDLALRKAQRHPYGPFHIFGVFAGVWLVIALFGLRGGYACGGIAALQLHLRGRRIVRRRIMEVNARMPSFDRQP